jgi:hypothetical protein
MDSRQVTNPLYDGTSGGGGDGGGALFGGGGGDGAVNSDPPQASTTGLTGTVKIVGGMMGLTIVGLVVALALLASGTATTTDACSCPEGEGSISASTGGDGGAEGEEDWKAQHGTISAELEALQTLCNASSAPTSAAPTPAPTTTPESTTTAPTPTPTATPETTPTAPTPAPTTTAAYIPQSCHGVDEASGCGSRIPLSDCDDDSDHGDFAKQHCSQMCGGGCTSTSTTTTTTRTTVTTTITLTTTTPGYAWSKSEILTGEDATRAADFLPQQIENVLGSK